MSFNRSGLTHVGRKFVAVTTSDTVQVPAGALGLYVGGTGDVAAVDQDGNSATFKAVPVGALLPISPKLIKATGTTATLMVLIY